MHSRCMVTITLWDSLYGKPSLLAAVIVDTNTFISNVNLCTSTISLNFGVHDYNWLFLQITSYSEDKK